MERPKELAIALLAAAFFAGGALGYAGGRYETARENMPGAPGAMRRYISDRLDLTPAQSAKMDSILDARKREMTRVIAPVQPQLDSMRTAARQQIMAILTPDQQKVFQEILAKRDKEEAAKK